ncbi:Vgb family protein [Actinoallomurus rhizosphaericola]|uniref:Vgb family protein n=1 Tax=Actinoallomurus rhizosphaericola TaxID=2952536 RepID=UPI0020908A32|nr:hypothetical protein [Actinoallomurus rhizosphaericola]MCO5994196.1 hypothetical protein [Actinoallomurus rhizosphaericola]
MRHRGSRAGTLLLAALAVALPCVPAQAASGAVTEFSASIPDSTPLGLTTGPGGSVWFTEHAQGLGRVDALGVVKEYAVPANSQHEVAVPEGAATATDGTVWFTDASTAVPRVGKVDPTTGAVTAYEVPTTGDVSFAGGQLTDVTAGPDGAMWFAGGPAGAVGRITSSGAVTAYATVGLSPYAITTGPDKALWFTDTNGGSIGRLDPATGNVTTYSPDSSGSGNPAAGGIAAGPDGAVWFTEPGVGKIGRIVPSTGAITEYAVPTANSAPEGITAGPDGNVWFTEAAAGNVGRIVPATKKISEYPLPNALSAPMRIVKGPGAVLSFTEAGTGAIGRLNPAAPPSGSPHAAAPPIADGSSPRIAGSFQGRCPTTAIICQTQITTGGSVKIGGFSQTMPPGALRVTGYVTSLGTGTATLQPPLTGSELESVPVEVPGGIIGTLPLIGPILGMTPAAMLPFNKLTITQSLAGPVTVGFGPSGLQATATLNIQLNNQLLGGGCVIGPITASLAPADRSGGSVHDPQLGWQPLNVEIKDNTLSVPKAHGCGIGGILDGVINSTMGLPSASGNSLDLPAILSVGAGAHS